MTVAEKIIQHVKALPESAQSKVLDFVEHLESKAKQVKNKQVDADWSSMSLEQAARGMENEPSPYSIDDVKDAF